MQRNICFSLGQLDECEYNIVRALDSSSIARLRDNNNIVRTEQIEQCCGGSVNPFDALRHQNRLSKGGCTTSGESCWEGRAAVSLLTLA